MFKIGDIVKFNSDGILKWNNQFHLKNIIHLNFVIVDDLENMAYIKLCDDLNVRKYFIAKRYLTNITRIVKLKKLMQCSK